MLLPRATLVRSLHRPHPTPSFFTPSRALDSKRTLFSRAQKPPGWKPFYSRHPRVFAVLAAPFVVGGSLGVALLGLWAYDASTYHHPHAGRVPVDPIALKPERGGKKNLKIAAALIDDLDERLVNARDKKRLVIVGGGWGGVGVLQHLDPEAWHVTVVSPETSATVGTVEVRSLVEPLRKIIARVSGHFLYGRAVDVDFSERLLEVACPGDEENFYLPYDKLVIACGSVNSTHGVPGLENCFQLKTVQDAQAIRRRVMDNLEKAALPSTEEEERRKLLSFVVCGGGPTGVEFASELWEMVNEDVMSYMPGLLRDEIKVHLIQSRDHILNTYAEKISEYAEERFRRHEIDMILNARVKEVTPEKVVYTTKDPETGKTTEHEVDSGFTLWSTGIAMNPFTQRVAALLPNQYHKHALEVDSHLRVIGAPLGTVYALGDCATIETRLVDHLLEFVTRCDENKDGKIDEREFKKMMGFIKRRFPASEKHFGKIEDIFKQYADGKGALGLNELADLFINVSRKITAFPATAQVAEQEGIYLAKKLNVLAKQHDAHTAIDNGVYDDPDDMLYEPFNYKHMGSLAYIGNSAVFDFPGFSFAGGLAAMYLWRSVYLSTSVTIRQRCLLMADWVKRSLFGRDLSKARSLCLVLHCRVADEPSPPAVLSSVGPETRLFSTHATGNVTVTPLKPALPSSEAFLAAVQTRRSLYSPAKSSPIADEKILDIVQRAIKHAPSPSDAQSSRAVVLFGAKHEAFWDVAAERFKAVVRSRMFDRIVPKLVTLKDATVLLFEDLASLGAVAAKMPFVAPQLPAWSENVHGIASYIVWTALEAEGLGASFQHYADLVQKDVEEMFHVPATWKLRANLVFGTPTVPSMEKTFESLEDRPRCLRRLRPDGTVY